MCAGSGEPTTNGPKNGGLMMPAGGIRLAPLNTIKRQMLARHCRNLARMNIYSVISMHVWVGLG